MKSVDRIELEHLMRRASLGVSNFELETLGGQSYEETVEQLLAPENQQDYDDNIFFRYHPMADLAMFSLGHAQLNWMYRMAHSQRYLQEKMALFWHHVFATGDGKLENGFAMHSQINMFREHGMGNYRNLLIELAKDPAMIFWLDNQENHKRAPNENWGRELLELFSLGVGHYTEKDVFECARAFTGWTFTNKMHRRFGPNPWKFVYKAEDHDNGEKPFLGHTGNFNGEDIIDIILKQPACAAFITRHLYNFFVADEPEVPKWPNEPPRDPKAIEYLSKVFVKSNYEIKPVLRALFNSDFFKEALYQKVKSPVEVVVGTLKLTGDMNGPDPRWGEIFLTPINMGQDILNPPTVEGWHTGKEWINSGAFINRVNFVADRLKNTKLPGVKTIIENVKQNSDINVAGSIVDSCLEELGDLKIETDTYNELIDDIDSVGGSNGDGSIDQQIADTLAMIAGTKEYQFC